jgi:hypothetical protein
MSKPNGRAGFKTSDGTHVTHPPGWSVMPRPEGLAWDWRLCTSEGLWVASLVWRPSDHVWVAIGFYESSSSFEIPGEFTDLERAKAFVETCLTLEGVV